ncbi:M28 family peptidase [Sphingomonas sabuli]|uniref:Vacuolar membrane protease n=1 Tax=Sphingomonas sabuli TaxID=2764186 RepID=A0A7G9L3A4_9SPHN|nr:M28 family peptidase [Sphingomonas sabuli]QNM83103.1 M28 family peptidase [Sphingomonas sabuli]
MRRLLILLALLAVMLAGLAATRLLIQPPAVRTDNTTGQFDAARAKARLAAVLGDERPHPTDSDGNDAVRDRLVAQLRAIGLDPVVRDQFACNTIHKQRGVTCARVRNVIAALGPASGRALLLNAHYDSTLVGPAAGDDGVGVATLMEVAALMKSERLERPILFLFNEGEELGLIGARAFLADPLSRTVDSLINLEARGTTGPVTMFETSLPNGPPVRAFAAAVDRPFANSLTTDFYRQLPNYTDVTSFEERGWTTLNFAMIGNETRYHSAGDNLAALDPRSMQHMGDQTLAVARQLAGGAPAGGGTALFTDIAGRVLVTVPAWLGFALFDLLLAAFAVIAFRRGGMWRALGIVLLALVGSAGLAWGGHELVAMARAGAFWRAYPLWTFIAAYACGLFAAVAAMALLARRVTVPQLRTGYWLGFLLLGALVLLIAPGGAIFFLMPPLAMLAGVLAGRWFAWGERAGAIIAALLLWLTLGEVVALLGELLVTGPFFAFAPLAMLVVLPWLIEAKALIDTHGRWLAAGVAGVLMAGGWAAVAAAPAYSADRQQRFFIQHATDVNAGKAYWAVGNDQSPLPEGYGGMAWRWGKLPYGERERWLADAAAVAGLRPPEVTVVESLVEDGWRTVVFRIASNGADSVTLTAPGDAQLVSAGNGAFVRRFSGEAEGDFQVTCFGRSCDGATLQLTAASPRKLSVTLSGVWGGLPAGASALVGQRPRNARPQYVPDSTVTLERIAL